jgi:alkylation response protein AidB-like acyl-CoA dehydrogenase
VDFEIPPDLQELLKQLDGFIEREIRPLEQQDDNVRFFDHRREWARTDYDRGGLPRQDWNDLLKEMRRRADAAGFLRYALPEEYGGRNGTNLAMAIIREHLSSKGLGLHNDLQREDSVVGNFPQLLLLRDFGTPDQQEQFMERVLAGERLATGITEAGHGSDATYMDTHAVQDGPDWIINGHKTWNTGAATASHDIIFARTSGSPGSPDGITAFIVPTGSPGFRVERLLWTFNMPTEAAEISLTDVRVPASAILGEPGHGLILIQHFVHEQRIRQAASSLGAAQYCIDEACAWANARTIRGAPLSRNQAIQFPLAELHTEAAMIRWLVRYTAWQLDAAGHMAATHLVAMCNYRANRLACDAADRAMQTCGGMGYSRHLPFEHIYRHHRRYRITEGAEEIQIRRVAAQLFGYAGGSAARVGAQQG